MVRLAVTEHELQSAYFDWVRLVEVQDDRFKAIFAIPNGGYRAKSVARKLKREGARAGVWDILIAVPRDGWSGLWLESKSLTGKLRPEQKTWGELMRSLGYKTAVCYSTEELIKQTRIYLGE